MLPPPLLAVSDNAIPSLELANVEILQASQLPSFVISITLWNCRTQQSLRNILALRMGIGSE